MADSSAAARKRRQRARRKAAGDPVRAFLLGVVADTKGSVADENAKTAPWQLAVADMSYVLLERLDAAVAGDGGGGLGPTASLIYIAHGAVTEEDMADLAEFHESEFQRWYAEPGNGPETEAKPTKSAKIEQAEMSLKWANDERAAKRGTSPVIRQGLRSAALLIRARTTPEAVEARRTYNNFVYVRSLFSMTAEGEPPYGRKDSE